LTFILLLDYIKNQAKYKGGFKITEQSSIDKIRKYCNMGSSNHCVGGIEMNTEKIIENCKKNLGRGRAVATGIGVFAHIAKDRKTLMRFRTERGSITGRDLSGNWELPGGGIELRDFDGQNYQSAILNALKRELEEETGLELVYSPDPFLLLPAWLGKNDLIDLAFTAYLSWTNVKETPEFRDLLAEGKIGFFPVEEIENLNITSPRMKFLTYTAYI